MKYFGKPLAAILLLANLAVIFWGWWAGSHGLFSSDTAGLLLAFGRLTGLLSVFCVLLEFVLIGRPVWLEKFFGHDKLAYFHHLNGFLALFFILVHPVLLAFSYAMDAKTSFWLQMVDFFQNFEGVAAATVAVFLFLAVVVLSIKLIRRHFRYEAWFLVHLLTYLAVILAFSHQLEIGGDLLGNKLFSAYWTGLYLVVFANFLVFKLIVPLYNFTRFRFEVAKVEQETEDTFSIQISGKNPAKFRMKAGQFLIIRFLQKGFWWEAHPFSVSQRNLDGSFRITIKKLGDFTSRISELNPSAKVFIEGPFGTFTPREEKNCKYLFIAGGVGITPIISILREVCDCHDSILLYAAKKQNQLIFHDELRELGSKYKFPIHFIISDEPDFRGEQGQINLEKLRKLVPDLKDREIYLCGPRPMTAALMKIFSELGIPTGQIHYEKFSF